MVGIFHFYYNKNNEIKTKYKKKNGDHGNNKKEKEKYLGKRINSVQMCGIKCHFYALQ